jgi:predicted transcriptional regulator
MRGASRQLIVFIEERPHSVAELKARTGRTLATIWAALSELCSTGIVVSKPAPRGTPGRPPRIYDLAVRA